MHLLTPWNTAVRLKVQGIRNSARNIANVLVPNGQPTIWMHCFSIGEFEQGTPLLEQLQREYPAHRLLVSFASASAYELKREEMLPYIFLYLPDDSRADAIQLADRASLSLVIWVKSPGWPYYLEELKKRNVPLLLLSGSFFPDQPFFSWYGQVHRRMLRCFTHLFVQTDKSKQLLQTAGISENVTVAGDTRFDRVIEIAAGFQEIALIGEFCATGQPVIVAGSTWEEDEEELDHYANAHPEIKFIIAPHHIDAISLRETLALFKRSISFSDLKQLKQAGHASDTSGEANVLVMDNIGMLPLIYRYATIAYVGGGFVDDGVHNVMEAAVYGKPVIYGPIIEEYPEAMDLVECGGGIVIDSTLEAEETFNRLLTSPEEYAARCAAARNYIYSKRGATERIMQQIQEKRLLTN